MTAIDPTTYMNMPLLCETSRMPVATAPPASSIAKTVQVRTYAKDGRIRFAIVNYLAAKCWSG